MTSLFIDTSGWASYFIPTESSHKEAVQHLHQAQKDRVRIVTTNYIIAELVALLGSRYRISRQSLFRRIESIKQDSHTSIFHVDSVLDSVAWRLCKSRPDKEWSLVDASSFVVMQQLDIKRALTTDRHFEQAGFIRLLKEETL